MSKTKPPAHGPERHAEAREHRDRAERGAHDARAEIVAHEHCVERHDAAVGQAEDNGQRVELAERTHEQIRAYRQGLDDKAGNEGRLGPDAVGYQPESDPAAETRETRQPKHADGEQCGHAAERGVRDHVEQRSRVRGATGEVGERDGRELWREKRLPAGRG